MRPSILTVITHGVRAVMFIGCLHVRVMPVECSTLLERISSRYSLSGAASTGRPGDGPRVLSPVVGYTINEDIESGVSPAIHYQGGVRMSFDIDVSVVTTLLLAVLVLGYGTVLGALVMWVGRIDERPPDPVRTAEPVSLRQAA
jgi:hypothetical protein